MSRIVSMLLSTRRCCGIGLCALVLALPGVGVASAQEQPEPAAAPKAVTTAPSKNYVLEGIIFVALCGGALYAVCRSSPRGT